MDEATNYEIERAVEAAVAPEKALVAEPQIYPEGVDLSPAFTALIEKMKPVRAELLKLVTSPNEHQFARERDLLVQYQGFRRAFHVLAGYVTPDGRVLEPMAESDPEHDKQRHQYIEDSSRASADTMHQRARKFSNVPLEPLRAERRGPSGYEPPVEQQPNGKSPGWLKRRTA